MSRVAQEVTVSVFVVTFGLLMLLKKKQMLSGVLFGLSFYVYTPNILLVPFLLLLYRKAIVKTALFALIIGLPIVVSLTSAGARVAQVNLTNDVGVITLVNEKRGACEQAFSDTVCRVVFNKYSAFVVKFATNYFYHFSPNLLSMYGTTSQFTILPTRGLLYLFEYPILIIAVISLFLRLTQEKIFLLGFLLFAAIPDSLTSDGNYVRYFVSYPVWPILVALGVSGFARLRPVIILGFLIGFLFFLVEYWSYFPYRYSAYSHYGYQELVQEIESSKAVYDRILVSNRVNDNKQYIFYLFYTRYDPARFQSGWGIEKEVDDKGWVRVKRIGNIEFVPTIPSITTTVGNILLVGAPSEFPKKEVPVEFTIKDKKGDMLFEAIRLEDLKAAL